MFNPANGMSGRAEDWFLSVRRKNLRLVKPSISTMPLIH
jgi:hypothetical protein